MLGKEATHDSRVVVLGCEHGHNLHHLVIAVAASVNVADESSESACLRAKINRYGPRSVGIGGVIKKTKVAGEDSRATEVLPALKPNYRGLRPLTEAAPAELRPGSLQIQRLLRWWWHLMPPIRWQLARHRRDAAAHAQRAVDFILGKAQPKAQPAA